MATLVLTVTETLRYRGKIGQWSWALHRISGLGTLLFLFLHVIDTSWSMFYPELYRRAIAEYQSPLFTAGEFALVACVVYHALNGFRISIIDRKPQWWDKQAFASRLVFIGTVLLLIPTFGLMGKAVVDHYQTTPFDLQLRLVIESQIPFVAGAAVALILGLAAALLYSVFITRNDLVRPKQLKQSRFDTFMWMFMRVSGVIIIPLVFGHLAMMHVIQGVFDITKAGHVPIGTTVVNASGLADEFVALRWQTMFAGVFIWRLYDVLMLVLVCIHGFNGLRYVVNDYVPDEFLNLGMKLAILGTCVALLIVGSLAIIGTVPSGTQQLIQQTSQMVAK